jgi:hypothetical protein
MVTGVPARALLTVTVTAEQTVSGAVALLSVTFTEY